MTKTVETGDISRNGLYQITCTMWDSSGTLRVTVREMIGERELPKSRLEAMRRFARRALPEYVPGQTRASTVRTWYAQGTSHATFDVSRNEKYGLTPMTETTKLPCQHIWPDRTLEDTAESFICSLCGETVLYW